MFMHDTFHKHLTLVPHVLIGCHRLCNGLFGNPPAFKVILTLVQEVLVEKLTTSDGFAICILDPMISNLGTECLHHLVAELSVYLILVGIVGSLLENEPDDLN